MQCYNQRMIENLKSRQQQEKSRLPKIQRSEAKTRMAMFKKSIRINSTGSPAEDREKIKQVRGALNPPALPCSAALRAEVCPPPVLPAGGEAAEGGQASSAAETRKPDEGGDRPV